MTIPILGYSKTTTITNNSAGTTTTKLCRVKTVTRVGSSIL